MSTRKIRSFGDLDAMVGRDTRIMRTVSPVIQLDARQEAYRDVLVAAFTKVPS